MEKKKNNAVEKTEDIANQNKKTTKENKKQSGSHKKATATKKNSQQKNKKQQINDKKLERQKIAEQKRKEKQLEREKQKQIKEQRKQEKEKQLAEKRVALARIKAHQKAERQKAKATRLREKNRRIMELKKRKQELKAQRQERREMLKKESKKERQARIAKEHAQKREHRENMRREQREKRQQIMQDKRFKREQKMQERQKNKDRRKGYGGWLAAVITLGVATLVLATALTFTFLMPSTEGNMLENAYQRSFYDTVEQVDNIDLNLSKVLASADNGAIQKYLVDTAINSELAESDIQQLPLEDQNKHYTTKLINQIGDYAKYLNNKLIDGQSLSQKDYEALENLYQANLILKQTLQQMISSMQDGYSFSKMLSANDDDIVLKGFNDMQNLSVQYPELIYDGPFSDGLNQREIKGLTGAQIDSAIARETFSKIFANYQLEEVKSVGESNGEIECFNVQSEIDGDILYAQISKTAGKLIMFSYAGSCNSTQCDKEQAIEKAEEFLSNLDMKDMKPVWINLANNVYTINFAFEQNGIIIYSDMVKVRVCAETQQVIGLEARSYYTNHVERAISKPALTKAQAVEKTTQTMNVKTARLVVVPIGTASERLCYELNGEYNGSTYYIYIDAISGKQVEMFKVIESTEGTLLM